MKEVVGMYFTKHGGIVQITKEEDDGREYFDAIWIPDFFMGFRLGEGSAFSEKLEHTLNWVRGWDPEIKVANDPGDFQLFSRQDEKCLTINLSPEYDCGASILAKDVPSGSRLIDHAKHFFEFWKGKDAVCQGKNGFDYLK